MRSRRALLRALGARDRKALTALAVDNPVARRALVQMSLERGDVAQARSELGFVPEEASERYWMLREHVATAVKDHTDLQRARSARAEIRARVQALLARLPEAESTAGK